MIEAYDQLLAETPGLGAQQRIRERVGLHLLGQLMCYGEHTVTGVLATLGQQFRDWSAAYRLYSRQRVDPLRLFDTARRAVEQQLPDDLPLVVALDDSLLRKRGRRIPGAAWRPDPLGAPFQVNFVWAQRVLQMAVALPEGTEGAARTVPIDFGLAPSAPRPRSNAPAEAWQAYREQQQRLNLNVQALGRLERLVGQRQQEGSTRPLWVTVDGRFTNQTFLKNVPEGVVVIGRIRGDARLHEAVEAGPVGSAGGRPRRYGKALPTPDQLRRDESLPWQTVEVYAAGQRHRFKVKTLERVRWRGAGAQRTLRLVVIAPLGYCLRRGGRRLYRQPAYLICTDPSVPIEWVVQAYVWRWGIEVNFRDEKTLLGVGQARVRNPHSAQLVPATAVAAYALLLVAAARAHIVPTLPPPAWRRSRPAAHATTAALINQLRYELWGKGLREGLTHFTDSLRRTQKSQKPRPHLESAIFYAIAG